jgi:competence protein ComEC
VPVTGAGASIQRAGVMGAAGVVAALADRPRSRWYALLLAAAATLALDPRASADVGWQLSFAAVLGILLFAAPLAAALGGNRPGRARRALAEGAALTISATLATAPLIAFHFGTLSLVTLPANLLAAPAEAPVMWLGMLAAAAGQLPWVPTEPVTWLAGLLAGYIGQIARWLGRPDWAQADLEIGAPELVAICAGLAAATALVLRPIGRRRGLAAGRARVVGGVAIATGALAAAVLAPLPFAAAPRALTDPDLRVRVLDVGEGSATLLEPSAGAPVLVDAGPADADVAGRLAELGIDHLAALVVSHGDSDHSGGVPAVLGSVDVDRLLYARIGAAVPELARARGARPANVAAGSRLRVGRLRLEVLWPPRRLQAPRAEPNVASVALVADLGRFEVLLPGDAEAEAAPIHPGDVDALVVAHHGSADAGLEALLSEADPERAVISVGASNPYGHPAPETVDELATAGVPVLRTDLDGEIVIEVDGRRWVVL